MYLYRKQPGFTIVELLVVIVVIAILASIALVAYNGITSKAVEAGMKSDLQTTATLLGIDSVSNGSYPLNANAANGGKGLQSSTGSTLSYLRTATGYCAVISNPRASSTFYITESSAIAGGTCLPVISNGSAIQTVANLNCPTARTRVVDARDNHTYWVQKLNGDSCWMLTNLGYAGGGVNTYGDARTLVDGTSNTDIGPGYNIAMYMAVPSTTNYTTEPTNPSTSTDGTGQYGYFYSRCGAAGGQTTQACGNLGVAEDASISVCPAGWRLPVMANGGSNDIGPDLGALNTAINGGRTNTDAGLRTTLLSQYGGYFQGSYKSTSSGWYWTTPVVKVSTFYYGATNVGVLSMGQDVRLAARCLAA